MSDANYVRFNERLKEIEARHGKARSGFLPVEDRDGVLRPVPGDRRRRRLPLRGLALVVLAFLLFKALLLAKLGPEAYLDRLGQLDAGNLFDRAGAWAMQLDAATLWLAEQMSRLF